MAHQLSKQAQEHAIVKKMASDTVLLIKEAGMFDRIMNPSGKPPVKPSIAPPASPAPSPAPAPKPKLPSEKHELNRVQESTDVHNAVGSLRENITQTANMLKTIIPMSSTFDHNESQIKALKAKNKQISQLVGRSVQQALDALHMLSESQGGVGRIPSLAKGILQGFALVKQKSEGTQTVAKKLLDWAKQSAQMLGTNADTFDKRYEGSSGEGGTNYEQLSGGINKNLEKNFGPGDPALKDSPDPNLGTKVRTLPPDHPSAGRLGLRSQSVGKFYKSANNWGWKLS